MRTVTITDDHGNELELTLQDHQVEVYTGENGVLFTWKEFPKVCAALDALADAMREEGGRVSE